MQAFDRRPTTGSSSVMWFTQAPTKRRIAPGVTTISMARLTLTVTPMVFRQMRISEARIVQPATLIDVKCRPINIKKLITYKGGHHA